MKEIQIVCNINLVFWFLFKNICLFYLGVDHTAGAIRGRSGRVIDVVCSEMEKYESGEYTEGVMESVRVLRDHSNDSFIFSFNKFK